MKIKHSEFDISITVNDLESIRLGLREWGKTDDVVSEFNWARLHDHFACWKQFVETDWYDWDMSEYAYEIECRYFIQLSIERTSDRTREKLEAAVLPIDDEFKKQMQLMKRQYINLSCPLRNNPYFWETHTIHPEML